jgi:hypothetical protein
MSQRKGANCWLKWAWVLGSTSNAKRKVGNLTLFYLFIFYFNIKQGTCRIKERHEISHGRRLGGVKLGAVPWTSRSVVDGSEVDGGWDGVALYGGRLTKKMGLVELNLLRRCRYHHVWWWSFFFFTWFGLWPASTG